MAILVLDSRTCQIRGMAFEVHQASAAEIGKIVDVFVDQHGDSEFGLISDEEYDRLFDHLASVLADFGTFSEDSFEDSDFNGCRYVDQIPFICNVPSPSVDPRIAVAAAMKAISTAHRPLAIAFDYFSEDEYILILPGGKVYAAFPERLGAS